MEVNCYERTTDTDHYIGGGSPAAGRCVMHHTSAGANTGSHHSVHGGTSSRIAYSHG